ncbi:MAG: hypothetical protein A2Z18_07755 [Armatimonadetes bacterium RBG_16_58_9]|nr:MAG: hypothetical protein A2Z18_07755 [Armatimonadetes bacterium RBG_16_58_9]
MRLMKRITAGSAVILLILSSVSISTAWAEHIPARILLGTREAPVAPSPVYDGKRVFAPLAVLRSLGASHIAAPDAKLVTVIAASGETGDVSTVDVGDTPMIPMDKVMQIVGGKSKWDSEKRTLTLLATLGPVEFVDHTLKINCSFPVAYSVGDWGGKLWIDARGATVESEAREVWIGDSVVERARLGQFNPTTARVALDLNKIAGYRLESTSPSAKILLRVDKDLPAPVQPGNEEAKPYKGGSFTIEQARVEKVDEKSFEVTLATSGQGGASVDYGVMPPQIVLKMPGARLSDDFQGADGSHPLLKGMRLGKLCTDGTGVRMELDFSRIMAYDIRETDSAIAVRLSLPDSSGGTLREKLIVIDPGHGGQDKGCHMNCGGVLEKDVTLNIARELAAALQKAGARTIITRGEEYISLAERPSVAINNDADFFISIHCNACEKPNDGCGIETYYYRTERGTRSPLAYAIQAATCSHTGMYNRGAKGMGLAVLRGLVETDIPGVLLECGFLNHNSDRAKLLDKNWRKKLCDGVITALRAYVEGSPIK